MLQSFFVSDLHGAIDRYQKLFQKIEDEKPDILFLGGDLLPSGLFLLTKNDQQVVDFLHDFLIPGFNTLKQKLGKRYPATFCILGNDDGRSEENIILQAEKKGIWQYIHNKKVQLKDFTIYGYSYVPPTPFFLKDWEKYDVSIYVDPGCISPEAGWRSIPIPQHQIKYTTIQQDLEHLAGRDDVSNAVFLFHTPPYQTNLDRAALDDKIIDHIKLDVHVGSIAVKRFIENRQPLVTLHGHIHESTRITGSWKESIGSTYAVSAAHDGRELALVRFDLRNPKSATRELV
ncbi:MAG: metallophosphoesterase [Deferribacteres bacterium]|nr:metallophosphoesterase [candidate division KSB1 bacterium]MCB9503435.1 metallophosphoesterase [Deferribacteres bacterium]